jgi:hypothetical protein
LPNNVFSIRYASPKFSPFGRKLQIPSKPYQREDLESFKDLRIMPTADGQMGTKMLNRPAQPKMKFFFLSFNPTASLYAQKISP